MGHFKSAEVGHFSQAPRILGSELADVCHWITRDDSALAFSLGRVTPGSNPRRSPQNRPVVVTKNAASQITWTMTTFDVWREESPSKTVGFLNLREGWPQAAFDRPQLAGFEVTTTGRIEVTPEANLLSFCAPWAQ